jgi:uncharacterized protein (TIGR02996 family)
VSAASAGPDREAAEAVALAVAELGALGKAPDQYRVVHVENLLQGPRASPVRWRVGFKLRALIPDILPNWGDAAPRLVYADWLLERDNRRGHFIVLSCKLARDKALSKSEAKQHGTLRGSFRAPSYLFGPISDFEHVVDRGLPSQITVNWSSSEITFRHLLGDPLLPCLDVIAFDTHDRRGRPAADALAAVMLDPTATRLVRVNQVPNDVAATRVDPRFEQHGAGERLADTLEPLVKARWKRDGRNFLRK